MAVDKTIVYTIEAKLMFKAEDDININEILDVIRGVGSANITNVEVVDSEDAEEDY